MKDYTFLELEVIKTDSAMEIEEEEEEVIKNDFVKF